MSTCSTAPSAADRRWPQTSSLEPRLATHSGSRYAAHDGFRRPSLKRRPLWNAESDASSRISYWATARTRGSCHAMKSDSLSQAACLASDTPNSPSGGLVWKPNSVYWIGRLRGIRRFAPAWRRIVFRREIELIVISVELPFEVGGCEPPRVYGWCATPVTARRPKPPPQSSERLRSACPRLSMHRTSRRNSPGGVGRLDAGPERRPIGAVSPNMISSEPCPVLRRPLIAARTRLRYSAGATAPPLAAWACSQPPWLGSFQIDHRETRGRIPPPSSSSA